MKGFVKTEPSELKFSPFESIGSNWMLIGASDGEHANAMTASWGAVGVMWAKNVFYCHIRPQRYTYELTEKSDIITLSVFGGEYKKELSYMGKESGRNTDKLANCGLSPVVDGKKVYFEEAEYVFVGKKLYASDLDPAKFIDDSPIPRYYPASDFHRTYICEIIEAYKKES